VTGVSRSDAECSEWRRRLTLADGFPSRLMMIISVHDHDSIIHELMNGVVLLSLISNDVSHAVTEFRELH
jgi:hypothetical protein